LNSSSNGNSQNQGRQPNQKESAVNNSQGRKNMSSNSNHSNQNQSKPVEKENNTNTNKRRSKNDTNSEIDALINTINPVNFDCAPQIAKFFVIKSYSEDDIHKSIKYNIWTSTESGNKRLDKAIKEINNRGPIYLFFSVNGSGQFCGLAEMTSPLDYSKKASCWNEDKWSGQFTVSWKIIKDVLNSHLRHIKLANNENKPVTNSRDTQEILYQPGCELLLFFHKYHHKTSILDDFSYYNECEKELQNSPTRQNKSISNSVY